MLKSLFGKNKNIEGKVKDNDVAHYRLNAKDNNSENKLLNYYNAIIFEANEVYRSNNKFHENYLAVTYGNDERLLKLILDSFKEKIYINKINLSGNQINFCVICFSKSIVVPIPERMEDFNFKARQFLAESLASSLEKNKINGFYSYQDSIFYKKNYIAD